MLQPYIDLLNFVFCSLTSAAPLGLLLGTVRVKPDLRSKPKPEKRLALSVRK